MAQRNLGPIWADPKCGDGECSRQTEYPGFGRFGCTADCGPYPAEYLSTLHIDVQPSYKVDETDAVMSDLGDKFLAESSWNLCTRQLEKDDKTGLAMESCWYAVNQKFKARAGRTERSIISPGVPGMDWYVKLNTPYGGTNGTVYVVDTSSTPYKRTPVYAWDYCSHTWDTKEPKIIAEEAAAPAGFIFNVYKYSMDTLIKPPAPAPPAPPPPPPPLPPMAAGLKAALTLKGYTKATFGLDEQIAFRESVASLLGGATFRRDRITITAITDVAAASGKRLLRRLLQTTYEVKISFTVALVNAADDTDMAANITSKVLSDATAFINKMNASGATNVTVPSGGSFMLTNDGVAAPPPSPPPPPPTPLQPDRGTPAGAGGGGVTNYCVDADDYAWVLTPGAPPQWDQTDDTCDGTCDNGSVGDNDDGCNHCLGSGPGLDGGSTTCDGSCDPDDDGDPCYKGFVPSRRRKLLDYDPADPQAPSRRRGTGRRKLSQVECCDSYGNSCGGWCDDHSDCHDEFCCFPENCGNGGDFGDFGNDFGSWGPSPSEEPTLLGVPVSDVEYKSPTSKVFLGSKSKTCAAGEKKLLLLSHIDQMANQHRYKVWVTDKTVIPFVDPDSPAYVGDGWANNVDIMNGYDLATDTENYGSGKATSTIYGSTPRYSNEGVDGEKEYRFDVFPDAIELCVPTATTKLTMVIAAITEGWDLTFGEDGQDKLSDRKFIPSFTIMDEDGCLAAPASGEACSDVHNPSSGNPSDSKQMPGAGASNHIFNFCPNWHSDYATAEGSRNVTVELSPSGTCDKLADLQKISDPANAIFLPEVALMEAIQEGYGEAGKFQLFSDYITDKTVNAQGEEVPCGTGYEEIHLLIEYPDATLDTFSYGIIATDDNGGGGTGKYTTARMSGGTLLSPQRYLTSSTGAEHTVKFPMRIDGEVAFDCVQDVSDAAPTVQSSYDDNVAYGVFNYEAAYKQADLLYMTEVPAYLRGRCSYKGKKPKLEVIKKCAKTGEDYKLHVFRAEYYVESNSSSTDTQIFITDKNGCEIDVNATATVPTKATARFEPATDTSDSFTVSATAGSYQIDPETGIDNCPSGLKKIYAPTFAARATGTKDGSVRATCPSDKNLVEVVTQTSWDGAKNAWTVQHVVFNDTLLLGGTKFTEAILSEAITFMYREQSVDNALQVDLWCLHPGNYSITLTDSSVQSVTANEGWRGGGVIVTDKNDAKSTATNPPKRFPTLPILWSSQPRRPRARRRPTTRRRAFARTTLMSWGRSATRKTRALPTPTRMVRSVWRACAPIRSATHQCSSRTRPTYAPRTTC